MERSKLICWLMGWLAANYPDINGADYRILLDQNLMKSQFTPLGTEPDDLQLVRELFAETQMYFLARGINRKSRRNCGVKGK